MTAPGSRPPTGQTIKLGPYKFRIMGVLKATLAIAGVYLVGLGVLLAVLFLLWK